jgi:hypothetical protein
MPEATAGREADVQRHPKRWSRGGGRVGHEAMVSLDDREWSSLGVAPENWRVPFAGRVLQGCRLSPGNGLEFIPVYPGRIPTAASDHEQLNDVVLLQVADLEPLGVARNSLENGTASRIQQLLAQSVVAGIQEVGLVHQRRRHWLASGADRIALRPQKGKVHMVDRRAAPILTGQSSVRVLFHTETRKIAASAPNNPFQRPHSRVTPRAGHGSRHAARR